MKTFEEILNIIEKKLVELDWQREPIGLYEPIKYALSLGGKRLRPALALMACDMFSNNIQLVENQSIGLEIFHNFTLLHDDIMDKAALRRGQPTVHAKWNANTAILSGDQMLIEAYRYISLAPEKVLKPTLDVFSTTATQVCEGQQLDMDFENKETVSNDEYIKMIGLKTAVLLGCALKTGAIAAAAPSRDAEHLYNFGFNLGISFQLQDDLLDVWGDEAVFGKKIGGDIVCNKKTYLLINALRIAKGSDKTELHNLLNDRKISDKEKIKNVTEIFNRLKIKELCEIEIELYFQKAIENLNKVNVPADKKIELKNLAKKLASRKM